MILYTPSDSFLKLIEREDSFILGLEQFNVYAVVLYQLLLSVRLFMLRLQRQPGEMTSKMHFKHFNADVIAGR